MEAMNKHGEHDTRADSSETWRGREVVGIQDGVETRGVDVATKVRTSIAPEAALSVLSETQRLPLHWIPSEHAEPLVPSACPDALTARGTYRLEGSGFLRAWRPIIDCDPPSVTLKSLVRDLGNPFVRSIACSEVQIRSLHGACQQLLITSGDQTLDAWEMN